VNHKTPTSRTFNRRARGHPCRAELRTLGSTSGSGLLDSAEPLLTRELGLRLGARHSRERAREVGAAEVHVTRTAPSGLIVAPTEPFARRSQGLRAGRGCYYNARPGAAPAWGSPRAGAPRGCSTAIGKESPASLGERGDIIKRMAMARSRGDLGPYRILETAPAKGLEGSLRGKGCTTRSQGHSSRRGSPEVRPSSAPVSAEWPRHSRWATSCCWEWTQRAGSSRRGWWKSCGAERAGSTIRRHTKRT